MRAVDPWRVLVADFMMIRCEMTSLHSTIVDIKACDTPWSSIFFQLSQDFVFGCTTAIGHYHSTGRITSLPSPTLLGFLAHNTPHLIDLCRLHCM